MIKINIWILLAALLFFAAVAASAQTFNTLLDLDGNDGTMPVAGLVQGTDGAFYGTAISGGANDWGAIFKVNSDGTITTLYSFCPEKACTDGALPSAGLTLTANGDFFGTAAAGGANQSGVVFKLSAAGAFSTVYSFCAQINCPDGTEPRAGLVEGSDGNLYGTTNAGGADGAGTVFRISREGALTTLHSFCLHGICSDGSFPTSGLIEGTDRNFYGTTPSGGSCGIGVGCGTVYKITRGGTLTTVYSFCNTKGCTDGIEPTTGLVQGNDGSFYGSTYSGGANDSGSVFKLTPQGELTTLYSFCAQAECPDGAEPDAPLIQATDGSLYGTTQFGGDIHCNPGYDGMGCGTLFRIDSHGKFTPLHVFEFTDGAYPQAPLMQSTSGKFYGTTYGGGTACGDAGPGCGTVFSLDVGLGPFVGLVRPAGKIGQTGPILGQGFTGTINVSLNGTPGKFTVISDTEILATVPVGATSGFVTVDTPSGQLASNERFYVLP
jgi:uncharacterized repeat protein (TIGR03803 family)